MPSLDYFLANCDVSLDHYFFQSMIAGFQRLRPDLNIRKMNKLSVYTMAHSKPTTSALIGGGRVLACSLAWNVDGALPGVLDG